LGRDHKTSDKNFFGLGKAKALSRAHCIIYYRDVIGGRLGQYSDNTSDELVYHPPDSNHKAAKVIRPKDSGSDDDDDDDDDLPTTGFYVIECLGKNRIIVNGQKVKQGETALLRHGSAILLASFSLYFLLPNVDGLQEDGENKDGGGGGVKPTTMQVPNPSYEEYQRKRMLNSGGGQSSSLSSAKRHKTKEIADDVSISSKASSLTAQSTTTAATSTAPTPQLKGFAGLVEELNTLPVRTLLKRMTTAINNDEWERKHQMLGTAIAQHAVRDAAKTRFIRNIAAQEGGVARAEIMKWISASKMYAEWSAQMKSKMEIKSYQSSIGKALLKAGFVRTGTTGRHVRWTLPADISTEDEDEEEEDGDDDDEINDDGEEGADDKHNSDEENEEEGSDNGDGSDDDDDEHEAETNENGDNDEEERVNDSDSDDDDDDDDEVNVHEQNDQDDDSGSDSDLA